MISESRSYGVTTGRRGAGEVHVRRWVFEAGGDGEAVSRTQRALGGGLIPRWRAAYCCNGNPTSVNLVGLELSAYLIELVGFCLLK